MTACLRIPAPIVLSLAPGPCAALLLLALAALLLAPAPCRAEGKVGFIDPLRVLAESNLGRLAKRDLVRAKREKEKVLQRSQERIAAMESGLPQPSVNGGQTPASPKTLEEQRAQHNRLRSEINQDLERESQELLAIVVTRVDKIMETLPKRKGFTMVIKDPNVIAFIEPAYDLTDDVIQALNSGR